MSKEVVDEIMRLVEYYNGATTWGTTEQHIAARAAIESKLRELVENKFSVREPLSDEEIEKATGAKLGTPMFLVATGFVRATERAHGIFEES